MSCHFCNKSLKINQIITGKCKCNYLYCNSHLFYNNHNCTFDFHSFSSNEIQNKNKKIVAAKLITF